MDVLKVYRGDIFYIAKKTETTGDEMDAGRPAVIVSNDIGNEHANIVEVVYLTTKEKKPMPTHVVLKSNILSTALCEQITTVSKERLGKWIRSCTDEEILECFRKEIKQQQLVTIPEDNKAEIERDLYKNLYEQLLEKVMQK